MPDRIEPPILISRLMTFVFASSLVVLGVLLLTLYNMFPLNRPQVFFLWTQQRSNRDIILTNATDIQNSKEDVFLRNFIKEYIKARNEVVSNIGSMRNKWNTNENNVVRSWSSDDVFAEFTNTGMWTALMNEMPDFDFECPVEFESPAVVQFGKNSNDNTLTYDVHFRYFCKYNGGQTNPESYTVRVTVNLDYEAKNKWKARLDNPLGVRVVGYEVINGGKDPLNQYNRSQTGKETE